MNAIEWLHFGRQYGSALLFQLEIIHNIQFNKQTLIQSKQINPAKATEPKMKQIHSMKP